MRRKVKFMCMACMGIGKLHQMKSLFEGEVQVPPNIDKTLKIV